MGSLATRGFRVRVLDNLSRPTRHSWIPEGVEFVKEDIRNAERTREAVRGMDYVVHLAALTNVSESTKNPKVYEEVNTLGTMNLLKACKEEGVKKFVFSSTCAVYGKAKNLPTSEEATLAPLSPYASSKANAERLCLSMAQHGDLACTILRLFNVYGRVLSGPPSGVIPTFIGSVSKGEPPVIYGTGQQTRDFVHVSDAVECIARAVSQAPQVAQILNVGTGKSTTILELADTIIRLSGKKGLTPIHRAPRPGEVAESFADTDRLRTVLGYTTRVELEEGLKSMITESQLTLRC